jgi:hypothetical protein
MCSLGPRAFRRPSPQDKAEALGPVRSNVAGSGRVGNVRSAQHQIGPRIGPQRTPCYQPTARELAAEGVKFLERRDTRGLFNAGGQWQSHRLLRQAKDQSTRGNGDDTRIRANTASCVILPVSLLLLPNTQPVCTSLS